jgi:nitrogen regulatory protein P-II 1
VKKVEAIVRRNKADDVKNALSANGFFGMWVYGVRGFGHRTGHTETYRGIEYAVDFVPNVKIELVCADENLAVVVETILGAARTGRVGDGKVFIIDLHEALRICTGKRGEDAV